MVNPVTVDVGLVEEATTVLDVAVEDEDEGNDDDDEDEGDEDEGDEVPDPVVVDIAVVDVDNVDNVVSVVDGETVVVGRAVVDDVAGSVAVWATAVSEVNDSGTPIASATARAVEMRLCECAQRTIPPRGKQHCK